MVPLHRQIVGPLNFYLPSEMMYENEKFSSSPLLKVYSQIKMVLLVDINKPFSWNMDVYKFWRQRITWLRKSMLFYNFNESIHITANHISFMSAQCNKQSAFILIDLPCDIGLYDWLGVLLWRESGKGCWSFGCLHLDGFRLVYDMHRAIIGCHLHQACWDIRISKSSALYNDHGCYQYRH